MLVRCLHCDTLIEGKHFKIHMLFNHQISGNLVYSCAASSCNRSFNQIKNLRKHYYASHEAETVLQANNFVLDSPIQIREVENSIVTKYQGRSIDNESSLGQKFEVSDDALRIASRFYSDETLSRIQVQHIVSALTEFLNSNSINDLKCQVLNATNSSVRDEINKRFEELQNAFSGMSTEHKRFKELSRRGCFIEPETITLGYAERNDDRLGLLVNKKVTASVIRLPTVLKKFFELPGVFHSTLEYITSLESTESNEITNIVQTDFWKNKISNRSGLTLPIFVYQDDFETGNALGTHASVYKMSGVYASIPCLLIQMRSKLKNIFLFQISHSEDSKILRKKRIYRKAIEYLNQLANESIEINLPDRSVRIFFQLAMIVGDNSGLNCMLGFSEGFGATSFCRFCKMPKAESKKTCKENCALLRTVANYESDLLLKDPRTTGIKNRSIWNDIPGFHVVHNYCVDIMHDLLEGVCNIDMALILQYFISKKYFTLEVLNFIILHFKYPPGLNPPPPMMPQNLKNKHLRMSAAEMLCFIMYSGIMFGDLVPRGEKYWRLFQLIRQILSITLQSYISPGVAELLGTLVEEHHTLFIELFGPTLIPKHHNMIHHRRIMETVGPLKHLWAIRYEAKHRVLEHIANSTCNRINLCHTIALKNQLAFSDILLNRCQTTETNITYCKTKPIRVPVQASPCLPDDFESYESIKRLCVDNVTYKISSTVVIGIEDFPIYGTILFAFRKMSKKSDEMKHFAFIVEVYETIGQDDHLQSFEVRTTKSFQFLNANDLVFRQPRVIHTASDGKFYIAIDRHLD